MKWILGIGIVVIIIALGVYVYFQNQNGISPIAKKVDEIIEKPLEKYSFENLKETQIQPSTIVIGKQLKDEEQFGSYEYSFCMDGHFVSSTVSSKKQTNTQCRYGTYVTGLINIPKEAGNYPVLLMFRGFVPREQFTTGEGTRRTAEEFARRGYITMAPDFLGYGGSDIGSTDSLEDRFQTYPTALTALASVQTLPQALQTFVSNQATITPTETIADEDIETAFQGVEANTQEIGIWGHSNGGHIALATLAITGKRIPTVLWNPVTKPFPYSILYFTDEYEDEGKALRKVVADFEKDYDIFLYSPSHYYDWIESPIQLHQALSDEAVPARWSDQFVDTMQSLEKEVEYFTYPNENHNFNGGSWTTIMQRNIDFYSAQFSPESE